MIRWIVSALGYLLLTSASLAQVGMGGMFPGPGTVHTTGAGITFTGTDAQSAAPAFSPGSFTAAIGTASADRIVTVCWSQHTGVGIAAPTYNSGNAFSLASGNNAVDNIVLYYANVTTGTTMSIDYAGGADGISIGVGVLKGQSGGGGAASTNPTTYTAGGAQPLSISLTVPSGGIGVACGGYSVGAIAPTYTWTGTTSGTGDETSGNVNSQIGLAHSTSTGTITVSSSTTLSFGGTMAAASWAP